VQKHPNVTAGLRLRCVMVNGVAGVWDCPLSWDNLYGPRVNLGL
jgi:hypothetical protein